MNCFTNHLLQIASHCPLNGTTRYNVNCVSFISGHSTMVSTMLVKEIANYQTCIRFFKKIKFIYKNICLETKSHQKVTMELCEAL